jgi:hypothetical protein
MTNITNELMYEVLKQIQADLRNLDRKSDEIKAEIQAVRTHVLGLQQDTGNIYGILARHDDRLDRIAHRLELSDAPASAL